MIDTSDPIGVGTRLVITGEHLRPFTGAVGTVIDICDCGNHFVADLDEQVMGYKVVALQSNEVTRSPYQGEPLVAVNNHD